MIRFALRCAAGHEFEGWFRNGDLSLAQTFVQYHKGVVEFESRPGRTIFRILVPLT